MSRKITRCLAAVVIFAFLMQKPVDARIKLGESKQSEAKLSLERRLIQEIESLLNDKKELTLKDAAVVNSVQKRATLASVSDNQFDTDILTEHNRLRKEEAISATAAYMFKMAHHDGLAGMAQTVSDTCVFKHSTNRKHADFENIGENLYVTSSTSATVESVVQSWYKEKANYNYAYKNCSSVCGHYTQVVWADSKYLGCAIKRCSSVFIPYNNKIITNAYLVTCQYGPSGNFNNKHPYEVGSTTCEKCPNNCVETALCETNFTIEVCEDKYSNCPDLSAHCLTDQNIKESCKKTCNTCSDKKKRSTANGSRDLVKRLTGKVLKVNKY